MGAFDRSIDLKYDKEMHVWLYGPLSIHARFVKFLLYVFLMSSSESQATSLLEQLRSNLEQNQSLRESLESSIKGVVIFVIDGERWILDLRPGEGSLRHVDGSAPGDGEEKGDIVLTMRGDVFVKLVSGKIGPQQAFLTGKLKIKGSMGLAMKLQPILDAVLQVKSSL
jgi:hypothetical protein